MCVQVLRVEGLSVSCLSDVLGSELWCSWSITKYFPELSHFHSNPTFLWDSISYSTDCSQICYVSDFLILLPLSWVLKIKVYNTILAVHDTLEAFAKFVQEKMLSLGLARNRLSQGYEGWWWVNGKISLPLCVLLASCSRCDQRCRYSGPHPPAAGGKRNGHSEFNLGQEP